MTELKTFKTIDQCVDFLVSLDCNWNYEKEQKLKKNGSFIYKDYYGQKYLILHDPYNLIS